MSVERGTSGGEEPQQRVADRRAVRGRGLFDATATGLGERPESRDVDVITDGDDGEVDRRGTAQRSDPGAGVVEGEGLSLIHI